ncbi:MAG: mannitol dehydrogenase family protein [Micrococcales bacterium]
MKLNRTNHPVPLAPERIVHIGIGAFAKAHQLWYTQKVDVDNEWGVVAFTGRTPKIAEELIEQDGLYTLVERSAAGDEFEIIDRVVRAVDGNNATDFTKTMAKPEIAVVTITITEAGYGISDDLPTPAISRLAFALEMRRRISGAPIALVSCDNIPNNGEVLKNAISDVFSTYDSDARIWLEKNVSFVSTSIDRITPKTTPEDYSEVSGQTGWDDNSVTVTEPFKDWVLCGEFPAGRPAWENAGAKFVTDIDAFEKRKLWLLNGAHSLLAYAGILRGHKTVAEAIGDSSCRGWVDEFWSDAVKHLPAKELDLDKYRKALIERFENPRIAHQLQQIAIDGATKLAVRIAPLAKAELASGAKVEALILGSWIAFLRAGAYQDSQADAIRLNLNSVAGLIGLLDTELAQNHEFVNQVTKAVLFFS